MAIRSILVGDVVGSFDIVGDQLGSDDGVIEALGLSEGFIDRDGNGEMLGLFEGMEEIEGLLVEIVGDRSPFDATGGLVVGRTGVPFDGTTGAFVRGIGVGNVEDEGTIDNDGSNDGSIDNDGFDDCMILGELDGFRDIEGDDEGQTSPKRSDNSLESKSPPSSITAIPSYKSL